MRRVQDWAAERGHDELWLTVWAGNARAIGFYTTRGFRTVGATAVRIGRCTDLDLVMSKALDPFLGEPERSNDRRGGEAGQATMRRHQMIRHDRCVDPDRERATSGAGA